MKLEELVSYFRKGGSYEEFCQTQSLSIESEVIEIYMEKPCDLKKEIEFFEIETTGGKVEYILNNLIYFNLFDFYYFLDVVEQSINVNNFSLTDIQIAKRLYDYAINDA